MKRHGNRQFKEMEAIIFDTGNMKEEGEKDRRKEFLMSFFVLSAAAGVLTGSFLSAFGIKGQAFSVTAGILLMSLFFTWFYREKRLDGKRIFAAFALIVIYGVLCLVLQERIKKGFFGTANQVVKQINKSYSGNMNAIGQSGQGGEGVFLLTVLFPVIWVLGYAVLGRIRLLVAAAVMFPVLAVMAVTGGNPGAAWLYLLLLLIMTVAAGSRSYLAGVKGLLAACVMTLAVSVPAWYVVKPILAVPVASGEKAGMKIQMGALQTLQKLLPRISGGKLNLSLEGIDGGVEDGSLGTVDGYYFSGIDALKVTSTQMPQETVYLKGFIGEDYKGDSFVPGDDEGFDSAAASWKTEGKPSIYIQNLPFLRMMYYENYKDGQATGELNTSAASVTVENLSANTAYTYVPYQAFLDDNYEIYGGDGYTGGQTAQQDIFSCYSRRDYKELLESYRDGKDTESILNRVEASYRAYCVQHDLEVPEKGLSRLKEECARKAEKENWDKSVWLGEAPDWQIAEQVEEIRKYVIKKLMKNCSYELAVDKLPEGEDFVENFLYNTKEGYSTHFAAAATMMFRLYGVPARYVVGYAAPAEMFTADENGNYTAVLQDDNAHAWTEIYMPFVGWTPVEVTPGMETEFVQTEGVENETEKVPSKKNTSDEEEEGKGFRLEFRLPDWLTGNLESVMLIVQLVLAAGVIVCVTVRLVKQRRIRLGQKNDPDGRIRALYHSVYRLLVDSGMDESCTAVMTSGDECAAENSGDAVAEYMQGVCPEIHVDEIRRMEALVLRTYYGFGGRTEQEAAWMLDFYGKVRRGLWRKLGVRKLLRYFIS